MIVLDTYLLYIMLLLTGLFGTYICIPLFRNMMISGDIIRPNYNKEMIPVSMGIVFLPMLVINSIILAFLTINYESLLYIFMFDF